MIRVRFAPSPTGYLHIGGLRTALYNYLFAKQNKGKLILRIEDTDQTRLVDGAMENLISTLAWSGIEFDEGPHKDGLFGPYTQSKRLSIYKEHTLQLIKAGNAYPCFYPEERIDTIKEKNIPSDIVAEYDRRYRDLDISDSLERMSSENHVIRLKVPSKGNISLYDDIRGKIDFDLSLIQDQIIIKSDGYPTYHLASVVDDHLMKISHVIRGEEWIASLPKHGLLYQSFGWELPSFSHLPLLLNEDRSKLSKRQGDVAVEDYMTNGYLKDALINFVSLLGWHGADDREIYNIDELINSFSINRIRSSGAVFDIKKLQWFNQEYIKKTDTKTLLEIIDSSKGITESMVDLVKESVSTLNDFQDKLDIFFNYSIMEISSEDKLFPSEIYKFLKDAGIKLKEKNNITAVEFKIIINDLKCKNNLSLNIWKPLRIALTGRKNGPDIGKVVEILGGDISHQRINIFLENNEC